MKSVERTIPFMFLILLTVSLRQQKIKLIAELNEMEWQLGAGGKQQCHVAMACEDTECLFVTASRHVHRVKKPTATSRYFLALMDKIREWKDEAIVKETKEDHRIIDRCSMIQYVIGPINKGNYGSHSDACLLLNNNCTARKMESPLDCPHQNSRVD
jgi:hypothetical protein